MKNYLALGCVSPGHIILAPLRTNRMAPLSTCCCGKCHHVDRSLKFCLKTVLVSDQLISQSFAYLRQEEGVHVEKLQSWAPRFIVVSVENRKLAFPEVKWYIIVAILPEENQFACTVDQQLDVVVALNHLQRL